MIFIDIAKNPQTGSITDNVCGKLNYKMNVIKANCPKLDFEGGIFFHHTGLFARLLSR